MDHSKYVVAIYEYRYTIEVFSGYHAALIQAWMQIPGREWDADRRVTSFPKEAKRAIWEAMCACIPGALCLGPKGEFRVPGELPCPYNKIDSRADYPRDQSHSSYEDYPRNPKSRRKIYDPDEDEEYGLDPYSQRVHDEYMLTGHLPDWDPMMAAISKIGHELRAVHIFNDPYTYDHPGHPHHREDD